MRTSNIAMLAKIDNMLLPAAALSSQRDSYAPATHPALAWRPPCRAVTHTFLDSSIFRLIIIFCSGDRTIKIVHQIRATIIILK